MKSICYIVPYFGKLPSGFQLWLMSCKMNPTIDWLIFTDDKTEYDYPENVKVNYCTFDDIRKRFQKHFDFPIVLDRGWKLCDYKLTYGEMFEPELKGYDFWGHCDVDLIWGDIRKYYTDEILDNYDKIGFLAHSTLYRNTPEVNARYKTIVNGLTNYMQVYSSSDGFAFDEPGIENIYNYLNIPYYKGVDFANLTKYETKFHLSSKPKQEEYKNERQIFTWENGKIFRYFLYNHKIYKEEYLYIHFWCRPMNYNVSDYSKGRYLIYSDVVTDRDFEITEKLIEKLGKGNALAFYAKAFWINRKKLTPKRIIFNLKNKLSNR